jgi:hypothetical protein
LTLRALLMGESVAQPELTEGVALRYWNEVYVPLGIYRTLEAKREYESPQSEVLPYF